MIVFVNVLLFLWVKSTPTCSKKKPSGETACVPRSFLLIHSRFPTQVAALQRLLQHAKRDDRRVRVPDGVSMDRQNHRSVGQLACPVAGADSLEDMHKTWQLVRADTSQNGAVVLLWKAVACDFRVVPVVGYNPAVGGLAGHGKIHEEDSRDWLAEQVSEGSRVDVHASSWWRGRVEADYFSDTVTPAIISISRN
jgi:hypothetical protein